MTTIEIMIEAAPTNVANPRGMRDLVTMNTTLIATIGHDKEAL